MTAFMKNEFGAALENLRVESTYGLVQFNNFIY